MLDHTLEASATIEISADRVQVWETLTNPEKIKKFLYGTLTETTWKPGSSISFSGVYDEQEYRDHGVVTEFTPFEKIEYSYWSGFSGLEDLPQNYCLVGYYLSGDHPDKTTLTWFQRGFRNNEMREHTSQNLPDLLRSIKGITELQSH